MNDRWRDTGPVELPAELKERLAELRGELLWGRLSGTVLDAGWLACELIEAGLDTPAVWELAGQVLSIGPMTEVEPLVRQVMVESGFPPIDLQRTAWAVVRDVAGGVADGTLPIGKGVDFLISELRNKCDGPEEIFWLMMLIDDWEAVRETPPTDDELREQTRKIADVARERLGAQADQER
jgi:hypothetical protein